MRALVLKILKMCKQIKVAFSTDRISTRRPHHIRATSNPPCTKFVIKVFSNVDSKVLLEDSRYFESSPTQMWENLTTDACSSNNQCDWHLYRQKYGPIKRSSEIAADIITWGKRCLFFARKWEDIISGTGTLWPLCNGINHGHRWPEPFPNF